jgi:hypothetical protein
MEIAGEGHGGFDHLAKGQSQPRAGEFYRLWQSFTYCRSVFAETHRGRISVCALSRRGSGDAGLVGRADRFVHHQCKRSFAAGPGRKVRAYAVTPKTRLDFAPEIPTAVEAGLSEFYFLLWHAVWAPKGTPKDVLGKLTAAVVNALTDPTMGLRLADVGLEVFPRDQQTPEALRAYQKAEIEKWWPIIKAAGIKAE